MKEVLCIIPARGGSKGLHKKNIKSLCGKPLIYYTINPAKKSKLISRIMVNTDDLMIAEISKDLGAEVPFLRPNDLGKDNSTIEDVLNYHLDWLIKNENYRPDIVLYLQPTDIFRTVNQIDECIETLINDSTIDSCFVGHPSHKKYWKNTNSSFERINTNIYKSRQIAKDITIREDTGIACATRPIVIETGNRIGKKVKILLNEDEYSSIDIHTEKSFFLAECIVNSEIKNSDSVYCFSE